MVTFNASVLKAGTFDSADVAAWRPTYFRMYSMPTAMLVRSLPTLLSAWWAATVLHADRYAGTLTVPTAAWRPKTSYMYSMPTGYAGTFDSADVTAWSRRTLRMYSMPTGYAGTFVADSADVTAWSGADNLLHVLHADRLCWYVRQCRRSCMETDVPNCLHADRLCWYVRQCRRSCMEADGLPHVPMPTGYAGT